MYYDISTKQCPLLVALLLSMMLAIVVPRAAHASDSPRAIRPAEAPCDGGEGVYLYEHDDFQGRCVKFTSDVPDLSAYTFNNISSSIRLVGDWTATLFVDQNYGGDWSRFRGNDIDLIDNRVGNDRASSVTVRRGHDTSVPRQNACDGGDGVQLYEHDDFQGRCIKLTADVQNLQDLDFNDITSSLRVRGDLTAILYRNADYTGIASTFIQDVVDMRDTTIGDNQATSIRVQRGRTQPLPRENVCDGGEGVYLYEHPQYQGRCVKFTGDAPDLRNYGFDDMASSVQVIGDWGATLHRDLSGTGISSTFTQNSPNLFGTALGDNQATSVSIQRGGVPSANRCDGGEGVYLYEHPQYQGRCVKFTGDAPDLRNYGFDDMASSVRVIGDWTASLYRDLSFTGIVSSFANDDSNIGDNAIGDNQATSVRVHRGGSLPAQHVCDGGEGVYIYEHPWYQGRCAKFTSDAPDLRTIGFDDIASSVLVIGRWTTTLYRDLSSTGIASSFTRDDSNLADDAVGDNHVTSLQVRR